MPASLVADLAESVAATIEAMVANGSEIVQPVGADCSRDYGETPRPGGECDWDLAGVGREECLRS